MLLKGYVKGYSIYEGIYCMVEKRANNVEIKEKACNK
jgi:hypothetical protein